MIDVSVRELIAIGKQIALHFETGLGYTSANVDYIRIDPASNTVHIEIFSRDDFQNGLPYENKFHHPLSTVIGETIGELWEAANKHPNRKVREMTVVLKSTEGLRESSDAIKSLILKEELDRIFNGLDELKSSLLPPPDKPSF